MQKQKQKEEPMQMKEEIPIIKTKSGGQSDS
jgi:hypothetical protein